jgi:hypothetical protein
VLQQQLEAKTEIIANVRACATVGGASLMRVVQLEGRLQQQLQQLDDAEKRHRQFVQRARCTHPPSISRLLLLMH